MSKAEIKELTLTDLQIQAFDNNLSHMLEDYAQRRINTFYINLKLYPTDTPGILEIGSRDTDDMELVLLTGHSLIGFTKQLIDELEDKTQTEGLNETKYGDSTRRELEVWISEFEDCVSALKKFLKAKDKEALQLSKQPASLEIKLS